MHLPVMENEECGKEGACDAAGSEGGDVETSLPDIDSHWNESADHCGGEVES